MIMPGYNERAWAIDVISEINRYSAKRSRAIVRAGGEHTVSGHSGSLFPDVLLFSDDHGSLVLQGWELKMPDTAINDQSLLDNAVLKAERLGLNSFVVWNANESALYLKNPAGKFVHEKSWTPTNIKRRADVASNRTTWTKLLHQIINDLNDLFDYGKISGARPEVAISDALFLEYLTLFVPTLSQLIHKVCRKDASFAAELEIWWIENKIEHSGCTQYEGIARVNLINWINRILFAHYLKRFNKIAGAVDTIVVGTSVETAIEVFENISSSCDFMNIFRPTLGQEYIDSVSWEGLISLNCFLKDFQLESISQDSFHAVIDSALLYSRKKMAGQFSTPKPLADLLVRLTIKDRTKPVVDPCCGTGTIPRAAYDLQRSLGASVSEALANVWASDKFAFPLQLCSIALSDPLGMGEVVQVFRHDAFDLSIGQNIRFIEPDSGASVSRRFPVMHAAISNLPFVQFEDNEKLNPSLGRVRNSLAKDCSCNNSLDGRSDLYAYLILKLRDLVEDCGRVGVICSNSWLAVEWGLQFKNILFDCFKIRHVVVSGAGRWFANADVVTTVLVLEKKTGVTNHNEDVSFITTTNRIETWEELSGGINQLSALMLSAKTKPTGFTRQSYNHSQIKSLEKVGIGWNAYFANVSWIDEISKYFIPANNIFDISRGERRGWDKLFYPDSGHDIEARYIKPVLKTARDITGLIALPSGEAFCCPDSIEKLTKVKMKGALNWISKFENVANGTGKLLPKVLAKSGCHWYEMSPSTLADMVVSMNPDQRLCVHKLRERSFVNQRLIRFTLKSNVITNIDICHALMNSVIGMFLIEAIGFGRGLGVLDLNATKLSRQLHMLNPNILSKQQIIHIAEAFKPLLNRNVLDLTNELKQQDRINFDKAVLQAYGIEHLKEPIYSSLQHLFKIRQTART